jgi:tungstate transport system substrate-binding protein
MRLHSRWSGLVVLFMVVTLILSACGATPTATPAPQPTAVPSAKSTTAPAAKPATLRLATTTSTADTGLLDAILPIFEKANNCKVDVVAVGTGQAIEIGRKGDADVLLVHARASEDLFVSDGFARQRYDVMYNDFVLVGPKTDPAAAKGMATAKEAFKAIMDKQALFVSRGDKSGTHTKELSVWTSLSVTPTKEMKWYNAIGQGMGDTLVFANEQNGYTLADRGTWLAMQAKTPNLVVIVGGNTVTENKDKVLLNPYGVMAVNPDKYPSVNVDLAMKFVNWLVSAETQTTIGKFGVDKYGQPLFYASASK